VRGGLDDALEKLARRDELRRRASGETAAASPAVTELVEAIAAVVARHPELGVTVGAEGAGDPLLLHFFFAEGQVQVSADTPVPPAEPVSPARHADFDIDLDDPVEERYQSAPTSPAGEHRRFSPDDQEHYQPHPYGYAETAAHESYYGDSDTAERRYGSFDNPVPEQRYASSSAGDPTAGLRDPGETSRDLGARMRDLGMASRPAPDLGMPGRPAGDPGMVTRPTTPNYPPHPFAATPPPPVPPQTSSAPPETQATRRIQAEHYRAPAEAAATERIRPPHPPHQQSFHQQQPVSPTPPPQRGGMPQPLPKPIPLQVERPEETEQNARRLAALLRDDPSLLNQAPRD
jgi:hypothetical protein